MPWRASCARSAGRRVERHERIDAQEQLDALVERDRRVQGLVERAVDVVIAVDDHRRKQARQRAGRLDRARDRHVVATARAERHRRAGVEVGRDEEELALELAEVVGAAACREQPLQEGVDRAVVEEPGRNGARERREGAHQAPAQWRTQPLERRATREGGKRHGPATEFAERGLEEDLGLQRRVGAVGDEQPVHLRRRDAVRERRGNEASRRHADVDVEVVEVEAFERVGEREQRADLIDAAKWAAAREREPDARLRSRAAPARGGTTRHAPPGLDVGGSPPWRPAVARSVARQVRLDARLALLRAIVLRGFALRVRAVFAGRLALARNAAGIGRRAGNVSRTRVVAASAACLTDWVRVPRAVRQKSFAIVNEPSTRSPTLRNVRDSTAVPSLISVRNSAPASFCAHSRVTTAAPRLASQTWRDAANSASPAGTARAWLVVAIDVSLSGIPARARGIEFTLVRWTRSYTLISRCAGLAAQRCR